MLIWSNYANGHIYKNVIINKDIRCTCLFDNENYTKYNNFINRSKIS